MQSFSFIPLTASEDKIFKEYFLENLPFMLPWQPLKISDLDKIHMNRRGLLKHFCKKNLNICSETAKIANFHFSHYKSMETIENVDGRTDDDDGCLPILYEPSAQVS